MSSSKIAEYICCRYNLNVDSTKIDSLISQYTNGSVETKNLIDNIFETLTKQSLESIIYIVSNDWDISKQVEKSQISKLLEEIKTKDLMIDELRTNYWNLKESVNKKFK